MSENLATATLEKLETGLGTSPVQYATDIKNMIFYNLSLRFWGKRKNVTFIVLKIVWNTLSLA